MFVTNSLTGGGAERATNILVNSLTDLTIETCLVVVNESAPDLIEPRCEVFQLKRKWQGSFISVLRAAISFQIHIWKWKPKVVVLNCDIPELLGAITFGSHRLIVVEHASQPWPQRQTLGRIVRAILNFRKADWVSVSKHLKVWALDKHPDISISNPIDKYSVGLNKNILHNFTSIQRLIFVGRLSPEKNPGLLIEISERTALPILFIGDGALRESLELAIAKKGIECEFKGYVKNPWEFLRDGDLLIIPSNNEGDGLVLVEAVLNRVPLIAINIPDLLRFNLHSDNYFNDIQNLTSQILKFRDELSRFVVNQDVARRILEPREPVLIAKQWSRYLLL
jgi:glycosyltransferase involved in cell wall biosynthesis